MSINYSASLKNTRMNDVKTAIDSGGAAGSIQVWTSGYGTLLATIPLAYPASSVTGAVLTLLGVPKTGTASAAGIAANARILNSAASVIVDGLTVGTSGSDITIDNTNIASGQTVSINSGTITHS